MKRTCFGLFGSLVLFVGSLHIGVLAQDKGGGDVQPEWIVSHEILVQFSEGTSYEDIEQWMTQKDFVISGYIPGIDVWKGRGEETAVTQLLSNKIEQQDDFVTWLEPNHVVYAADMVPNDTFYLPQQENLQVIGLPSAWEISVGNNMQLAIIDTGVDLDHSDLVNKIWLNLAEIPDNGVDDDDNGYVDDTHGWDFVNNDNVPQDDNSHGSFVSGIAAAESDNGIGIASVSWQTEILPLKVLNSSGSGNSSAVAEAIIYAADNGVKIINLSLETDMESQALADAVVYAADKGCLMIAAVGNGGGDVSYPAKYADVLAVSATNNQDIPWSYGNKGPEVDISAPGVDIFSTNRLGSYNGGLDGTSYAAPHVSGVAALMWSLDPELTPIQIRQILVSTAKDVWSTGWDSLTGWGRLDANAALQEVTDQEIYLPLVISN
jgi:subtilisin family serine protease